MVISSLLFSQRQMRAINDPARLAAVDALDRACRAARDASLQRPVLATPGRIAADYQITLLAGQSFRIEIDSKIDGILFDTAGGLTAAGLAVELLTTLTEPYRTFYREMLETAVGYWRQRRPSLIESTWVWSVALRRLDQLTRGGAVIAGEPQACETCGLIRPSGAACLHCGAAPGSAIVPGTATLAETSPPIATAAEVSIAAAPPLAITTTGSTKAVPPAAPPPREEPAHSISPAQELAVEPSETEKAQAEPLPLAGLGRRLGASVLDLAIGAVLGLIGAFGLTVVLLRAEAFGPADSPGAFLTMAVLAILGLYFVLGWAKNETLGSFLFRLRILRADNHRPAGLLRAVARTIGYLGLVIVAGIVFVVLNLIDQQLIFIQGVADLIVRIIIGIIALYILWIGWGQAIISAQGRQTWGDRLAGTLVTVKRRTGD